MKKNGFNLIITRSYSIDLMLGYEELMKTGLMHKNRGFHPLEITVEIWHSRKKTGKLEICSFNVIPLLMVIFTWHKPHKDNLTSQSICCLVKALLCIQTLNTIPHLHNLSGMVGLINKLAPELCDTTAWAGRLRAMVQPAVLLQARTKGQSQSRD